MRAELIALSAALALAASSTADAQCLPEASRPAFRAALLQRLRASTVAPEVLYRHAHDRLGFGTAPQLGGARPPATGDAHEALADLVVQQLARVANVDLPTDELLAGIDRGAPVPDTIGYPTRPFRHAGRSMAHAYTETQAYMTRARALREELDALPPTDPRRAALEAELKAYVKNTRYLRRELRDAASARALARATLSQNADFGALLAEFWFNHFNVDAEKVTWPILDYQSAVQRRACGTFEGMLVTVAKHPAMAIYLDNFRSKKGALNENYARELMELHTLGDDLLRYYDHEDIVDVARVLSGWAFAFEPRGDLFVPGFKFYDKAHDGVAVTLFDKAPEGRPLALEAMSGPAAVARGDRLLTYLASHVATRRNVCTKLSRRLIGDAPVDIVRGCVADAVWGQGGDLASIYRYFLLRPEMWQASPADDAVVPSHRYAAKDKTPLELLASAHRALVASPTTVDLRWISANIDALGRLGLIPARTAPPTGYPDGNVWISSGLMIAWNQELFSTFPTERLWFRVNGRVVSGAELEQTFAGRVAADGSVSTLRAIGAEIARDVVRAPRLALEADNVYPALVDADLSRPGNLPAPLRSYTHALLGHANFLRK